MATTTADHTDDRSIRTRRPLLAASAAAVAASAWGGAAGLIVGFAGLPDRLVHRLPFSSPVAGGFALALVIAVAYSILTFGAWRGRPWTAQACLACGVVLVSWIAVQLAFLRQISFLHPLLAVIGGVFAYAGRDAAWRRR